MPSELRKAIETTLTENWLAEHLKCPEDCAARHREEHAIESLIDAVIEALPKEKSEGGDLDTYEVLQIKGGNSKIREIKSILTEAKEKQ